MTERKERKPMGRRNRGSGTIGGRWVLQPTLALLIVAVACAPRVHNPFQAPPGRNQGDPAIRRSVRFEVDCARCAINWSVQEQSGSTQHTRVWSKQVIVYVEPGGTVATLSATPLPGSSDVRRVRIRVDGEVAAEDRRDQDEPEGGAPIGRGMSITAAVEGRKG